MDSALPRVANGDINRARFVKMSSVVDRLEQAGAGEFAVGISSESARAAPVTGASDLAASAGQEIMAYPDGEECWLTAGGTFAVGAYLKSDSSGRGVTASSTQVFHAIAKQAASAANQMVRVIKVYGITP